MSSIRMIAKFPDIAPENLDRFKELARTIVEATKSEEGTRVYGWFISSDGRECLVYEDYESSDAVLAHMGNVGEHLGPAVELGGGLEVNVIGDPSPELQEAAAAFEPKLFEPIAER